MVVQRVGSKESAAPLERMKCPRRDRDRGRREIQSYRDGGIRFRCSREKDRGIVGTFLAGKKGERPTRIGKVRVKFADYRLNDERTSDRT